MPAIHQPVLDSRTTTDSTVSTWPGWTVRMTSTVSILGSFGSYWVTGAVSIELPQRLRWPLRSAR